MSEDVKLFDIYYYVDQRIINDSQVLLCISDTKFQRLHVVTLGHKQYLETFLGNNDP